MPVVPSKAIVPAPPNVSFPNDRTSLFEPVRWIVPLSVRPPLTRKAEFVPDTVRSPSNVTSFVNVPLVLSELMSTDCPGEQLITPPDTVPPAIVKVLLTWKVLPTAMTPPVNENLLDVARL